MSSSDSSSFKPSRVHPRYAVDWRVSLRCQDWGVVSRVAAQNASRGGVFLLTARPPAIGSEVELAVELPDGTVAELRGRVQHVITPERALAEGRSPGIGVKIDARHDVDLLLLEQMAVAAEAAEDELCSVDVPVDDLGESHALDLAATQPSRAVGRMTMQGITVSRVVGIDFGTWMTRVAYAAGGRTGVVTDEVGRGGVFSLVGLDEAGGPLVGHAARPLLGSDPRHTFSGIKRLLGRRRSDPLVAELLQGVPFPTQAGPGDEIWVELDGKARPILDVAALVLAAARELAERQLRRPVREALLAVPTTYGESQRAALRLAAQRGGLEVAGLVDEPVAAAVAAGAGAHGDERLAVIDLGGGGTSVTLLDVAGERVRQIAHDQDPWLSGADFDTALAGAAADELWRRTRVELRKDPLAWARLLLACEDGKLALSREPACVLTVERVLATPRPLDLRYRVDRAACARLSRQLLERVAVVWRRTLAEAGIAPDGLGRVLLVGGIARLPFVATGLGELLARPLEVPDAPDELVASGAALRAAGIIRAAG